MRYCKKCGAQLESNTISCPKCGMSNKHCSYCGTELIMEATICPSCGAPVISDQAAIPPVKTETASEQRSAEAIAEKGSKGGSNFIKIFIAGAVIIAFVVIFVIYSDTRKTVGIDQDSYSATTNMQQQAYSEKLVQVYNNGGLNVFLDKDSIDLTEDGAFIKFTFSIYMENEAARKIYDNFYHVKGTQNATYRVIASKNGRRFAYLSKIVVDNNGRSLFLWNEPSPNSPNMKDMSQNERVQKCFDLAVRTFLDSQN